jgi:hypothetical protein
MLPTMPTQKSILTYTPFFFYLVLDWFTSNHLCGEFLCEYMDDKCFKMRSSSLTSMMKMTKMTIIHPFPAILPWTSPYISLSRESQKYAFTCKTAVKEFVFINYSRWQLFMFTVIISPIPPVLHSQYVNFLLLALNRSPGRTRVIYAGVICWLFSAAFTLLYTSYRLISDIFYRSSYSSSNNPWAWPEKRM